MAHIQPRRPAPTTAAHPRATSPSSALRSTARAASALALALWWLPACTFSVHWGSGEGPDLGRQTLARMAQGSTGQTTTVATSNRPSTVAKTTTSTTVVRKSKTHTPPRPAAQTTKTKAQLAARAPQGSATHIATKTTASKITPAKTTTAKATTPVKPTLVSTVAVAPSRPPTRNTPAANPVRPPVGGSEAACYAGLQRAGIDFERVAKSKANGLAWPILLNSDVAGIAIKGGGKKNAKTNYLDCRLAQALVAWAPSLRRAGVTGLQHYSMYRAGARIAGSGKVSSHAHGLSIDVARFVLSDGATLSVLDDWGDRDRGEAPCTPRPKDSAGAALMRSLVCEASSNRVFQTVITPHYNAAHDNHVHLEVNPQKSSPWIH